MLTNVLAFFVFFTTNTVVTTNNDLMTQTTVIEANHVLNYVHEGVAYSVTNMVPFKEETRYFKHVWIWQEMPAPPSPFPIQAGEGIILEQTPSNIVIKTVPVPMPYIQMTNFWLTPPMVTNLIKVSAFDDPPLLMPKIVNCATNVELTIRPEAGATDTNGVWTLMALTDKAFNFSFHSETGKTYRVQWTPVLKEPWQTLPIRIAGTGADVDFYDVIYESNGFYRTLTE